MWTYYLAFLIVSLLAHEGHTSLDSEKAEAWMHWIGILHPILLHFPIVFILSTGLGEWMFYQFDKPIYDEMARFSLILAAITIVPTALSGLAYGYAPSYEGVMSGYFWWHRAFGIGTTLWTFLTLFLRWKGLRGWYITCLIVLILSISITGLLGGFLTFGDDFIKPFFEFSTK